MDIFILKLDATGGFIWAKKMGGADFDIVNALTLDNNENVYTTGYFYHTADFDPGPGTYNLTGVGSKDMFISKLDEMGNFVYAKLISGQNDEVGQSIALDRYGNTYITGYFSSTVDFDPGPGIYNLTSINNYDNTFVLKLNLSGAFEWCKHIGGIGGDMSFGIVADNLGNSYCTGYFYGTLDFDLGPGIYEFSSTLKGYPDAYALKFDPSGNFVWAKKWGGERGNAIALDSSSNIYIAGSFIGTADFDPDSGTCYMSSTNSQYNIFISKLNSSGNFIWSKNMGNARLNSGNSIALDALGNIYLNGEYSDSSDFDPGVGSFYFPKPGLKDIFISKLYVNSGPSKIFNVYPNPVKNNFSISSNILLFLYYIRCCLKNNFKQRIR